MTTVTVTVTWMDRLQEVYSAEHAECDDHQLHITLRRRGQGRPEKIHIPLVNVRTWLEER